jgi:hypothetical protein
MYSTADSQPIYENAGCVPTHRHLLEMELL